MHRLVVGLLSCRQAYREQVDRVDSAIAGHLRDRLGAAQSGEDMFRIFSRFNVLLVRPKVQGAIQQFQSKVQDCPMMGCALMHCVVVVSHPPLTHP